jgi:hypothetical protein
MIRTRPISAMGAWFVVPCTVALVLSLAACRGANPSTSPSAGVIAGNGTAPSVSPFASVSPVVASQAAVAQPQTIHLIEHPTNYSEVHVASCSNKPCQGDYFAGDDPMFDAATGAEVGTIMFECFLVDPGPGMYHCPGITITLTGRGEIVFTEKFNGSSQTSPITGGTGEFLGATGTVISQLPPSGNGDFVITITI